MSSWLGSRLDRYCGFPRESELEQTTKSDDGRTIRYSFFQEHLDRVATYHQTETYKKAYQKRKVWVEPLFGEAQQWHGLK